eukprot:362251-Chlamydomonas_euryale.AAC.10
MCPRAQGPGDLSCHAQVWLHHGYSFTALHSSVALRCTDSRVWAAGQGFEQWPGCQVTLSQLFCPGGRELKAGSRHARAKGKDAQAGSIQDRVQAG